MGAYDRVRERPLHQRRQPLLHRQPEFALGPQRLEHVGQHVGEQHLVAQPLFAHDQQGTAVQIVVRRPARTLDHELGEVGVGGIEPGLVSLPAFGDAAEVEQQGRAGQPHHRQLFGQAHLADGGVVVFDGQLGLAQGDLGVAAVVARPEIALVAVQGLAEE